jgi:5-methylcytosine-specific restriction endonuclease McrA
LKRLSSKRAKALSIPKSVKDKVYERDNGCCVWCGSPGLPEAHYIARSRSGLGIEENILTLCRTCHNRYDFGTAAQRQEMKRQFKLYLSGRYTGWDEGNLIYKGGNK